MKTFYEHWMEIEKYFEWEQVHKVMKFLNWTWHYKKEPPTVQQLKETARDLLETVYPDGKMCGTGGFIARYDTENDQMELSFYVDNWKTNE